MTTVTCSVCFKPFESSSPLAESWIKVHPRTHDEQYKRGCLCCSCRRWRENWRQGVEIMEPPEVKAALEAAKNGKPWAYAAFCAMLNAMLHSSELIALTPRSLIEATPCRLKAGAVEVPLDCRTVDAVRAWIGRRSMRRVFPFSTKAIEREWRATTERAVPKLYAYKLMALRHTGIAIRGAAVRTLAELVMLKREARLPKWKHIRPYAQDAADLSGYYERVIKASGR